MGKFLSQSGLARALSAVWGKIMRIDAANTATTDFSVEIPAAARTYPVTVACATKGDSDTDYAKIKIGNGSRSGGTTRYNVVNLRATDPTGTVTAQLTSAGALTVASLKVSGGSSEALMTSAGGSLDAASALSLLGLSQVDTSLGDHTYLGSQTVTSDNVVSLLQQLLTALANAGVLSTSGS